MPLTKRLRFVRGHTLADIVGGPPPRTRVWVVRNVQARVRLGLILWRGSWRQYVFAPDAEMDFEKTCLRTIADFCERQTSRHYKALRTRKESL